MPALSVHEDVMHSYLLFMIMRDVFINNCRSLSAYRYGFQKPHHSLTNMVSKQSTSYSNSEDSVLNQTRSCFRAIKSLYPLFVQKLSPAEMYDGTIAVLYCKPGLNGDAYYTRKANELMNCVFAMASHCLVVSQSLAQHSLARRPPPLMYHVLCFIPVFVSYI